MYCKGERKKKKHQNTQPTTRLWTLQFTS